MNTGEILELDIVDVAYKGAGVARHDGCVVFIPDVISGERVRAEIVKKQKKFANAKLVEVLEPSSDRVDPTCKFADICQGCCYQHVEYKKELSMKQTQLVSLLERIARMENPVCLEPVGAPASEGYRNKIVLHVQKKDDAVLLGYMGEDNKTVFDVDCCPLAVEAINDKLTELRSDAEYLALLKDGTDVTFRYSEKSDAHFWAGHEDDGDEEDAEQILIAEETAAGSLSVPEKSFFQVNLKVSDLVVNYVMGLLKEVKAESVVDAYCGVGLFSFAAHMAGVSKIIGLDIDANAIKVAKKNASNRGLAGKIKFTRGASGEKLASILGLMDPKNTAVIVDPPRRGLSESVLQVLSKSLPHHLIYISCSADMMARDAKVLIAEGYKHVSSQLFDMFPRTASFESVSYFRLDR